MSAPLRVLIAGGGVAGVETALALRALASDRVTIELLSSSRALTERPWSVIAPFVGVAAPRVPLDALGVRRHPGALEEVDADLHRILAAEGDRLGYDRLVVATGARRAVGVPGAVTFFGSANAGIVGAAVRRARSRVLLVAPPGCGWTLPIYELALIAAQELQGAAKVAIASFEPRPLDVFGRTASDAVARLLDRAGIEFMPNVVPVEAADVALVTTDDRLLSADAVITLPRLRGPRIEGLPQDADGFMAVDRHGRVPGVADVFAAGDATTNPIKQGGLATQQADAVAEAIAAEAGAAITPRPSRRILRAALLTGEEPLYLRRDLDAGATAVRPLRSVARRALWYPDGKLAGRHLTGFLARCGAGAGATLTDIA